jgi:hypothetical protein
MKNIELHVGFKLFLAQMIAQITPHHGHSVVLHMFDALPVWRPCSRAPSQWLAHAPPPCSMLTRGPVPLRSLESATGLPHLPPHSLCHPSASLRSPVRARPPWLTSEQSSCRCFYRRSSMSSAAALSTHAPTTAALAAPVFPFPVHTALLPVPSCRHVVATPMTEP